MGGWYLSLSGCLLLVFIGMYTHWTLIAVGALLPFVPLITYILKQRADRRPKE